MTPGTHDVLAVDIGGTKILAAIFAGQTPGERPDPERTKGWDTIDLLDGTGPKRGLVFASRLLTRLRDFAQAQRSDPLAIGIACCGHVDFNLGLLRRANNLGLSDLPLREYLRYNWSKETEVISPAVVVENDGNAAAFAEATYGAGKNLSTVVYVTVSTGIGGGVVEGGRIRRGTKGAAAEFGSIETTGSEVDLNNPRRGHWSREASGTALASRAIDKIRQSPTGARARKYRELIVRGRQLSARDLASWARDGDRLALELFRDVGDRIGFGLSTILAVEDPDLVVLGGGMMGAYDLWGRRMQTILEVKHGPGAMRRVSPAAYGTKSALVGAAELARQAMRGSSRRRTEAET